MDDDNNDLFIEEIMLKIRNLAWAMHPEGGVDAPKWVEKEFEDIEKLISNL
tara:strand:- start:711 stop:863 length:153 start_codon:yes stop_codon:yes gene_type:complete